jgi:putative transposase
MTSLMERTRIIGNINTACRSGAALHRACDIAGVSLNCWYRWQQDGVTVPDRRPDCARAEPANKLSAEECAAILNVCNSERFGSLPPSQIVPTLTDEGRYLASESSFYRVLRQAGQAYRRGRVATPRTMNKPTSHTATAPNQVWSWDVTWLPGAVKGQFYKLYLIEDIFSRFPVGWEVHAEETGELAAELVQRTVLGQRCVAQPLVLHADNGAPMKSYSLKAKLEALGIIASHSRPRVSNDNPFSESLFRTLKYWPKWPSKGFATLTLARQWVARFIDWYSNEHRHSGIRFVTPAQRHQGQDQALLQRRHVVYQTARLARPERWSGATRNWSWIEQVQLNPDRFMPMETREELIAA